MEQKKLTRDQTLVLLLRENEAKTARISSLEKKLSVDTTKNEKRLKRLEDDLKRVLRELQATKNEARMLKERYRGIEGELDRVKQSSRRIQHG